MAALDEQLEKVLEINNQQVGILREALKTVRAAVNQVVRLQEAKEDALIEVQVAIDEEYEARLENSDIEQTDVNVEELFYEEGVSAYTRDNVLESFSECLSDPSSNYSRVKKVVVKNIAEAIREEWE